MRIALISPPWLSPYRPSLQIAALQAWLGRTLPEVTVDAFHDHLAVAGFVDPGRVCQVADGTLSSWLGEALSAYLLFPARRPVIDLFFDHILANHVGEVDLEQELLLPYARYLQWRIGETDWGQYDLVGISNSLCQTLSSALLARRIRQRSPRPLLVLGGPAVSGRMGESFLATFSELDAIVQGEGERPLELLLRALLAGQGLAGVPGVLTRTPASGGPASSPGEELADLAALPLPDYRAYFATLAGLPPAVRTAYDLELPVEGARGCWWDRRACRAGLSCQFCNLNLQWKRYREKSVDQQLGELQELITRHGVKRFLFVDNVTRRQAAEAEELFVRIARELPGPLRIYLEARANVPPRLWQRMAEAGVTHCQVGVEALATSLLRKIGKGTTTIINLEAMRELERWDIANPGNLIYDLPETTVAELEQTLEVIPAARAFYPLGPVRFFLNYGSPYYDRFFVDPSPDEPPRVDQNYLAWQALLPPEQEQTLFLSEREFELAVPGLPEQVARLQAACASWSEHYWRCKEQGVDRLLLQRPASGAAGELEIVDWRESEPKTYLLTEEESKVLIFFDRRRPVAACQEALPELSARRLEELLAGLVARRLVFREGKEALALPLPARDRGV
ncbi:MAG: RiPP maturation radical SAM C-methyltransferase [Myxococcota bacterium]|jgi:ribosomal peptide maturation radical SAM protein 1|nr:RiPP maturation radical SAM C-methyltransferase [Myxococcota bacterium]